MTSEPPRYADRCYRSGSALAGGVLLLLLAGWIGGDAIVRGEGRAPWVATAVLLTLVPLVVAFTLRPAVYAGEERLRVRNPFRTITLPWAVVDGVRARLSSEVLVGDRVYQLWAIPVSLRQRKKAAQRADRAATGGTRRPRGFVGNAQAVNDLAAPSRSTADQAVDELNALVERNAKRPGAQGAPRVRWAYEIIGPTLLGVATLAVLLVTG